MTKIPSFSLSLSLSLLPSSTMGDQEVAARAPPATTSLPSPSRSPMLVNPATPGENDAPDVPKATLYAGDLDPLVTEEDLINAFRFTPLPRLRHRKMPPLCLHQLLLLVPWSVTMKPMSLINCISLHIPDGLF